MRAPPRRFARWPFDDGYLNLIGQNIITDGGMNVKMIYGLLAVVALTQSRLMPLGV